jgi:hypothetical protein
VEEREKRKDQRCAEIIKLDLTPTLSSEERENTQPAFLHEPAARPGWKGPL